MNRIMPLNLTIKNKLFLLGSMSVLALAIVGYSSYQSSAKVIAANDRLESINVMDGINTKLRVNRLQMTLSRYEAIYEYNLSGAASEKTLKTLKDASDAVVATFKQLSEKHNGLIPAELITRAQTEIEAFTSGGVTKLLMQKPTAQQIDEVIEKYNVHRKALKAILVEIDKIIDEKASAVLVETKNIVIASQHNMMTIIAIASGILVCVLALIILSITRPLKRMSDEVKRLADADYDAEVTGAKRKDEIGLVSKSLLVFKQNGIEKLRLDAQVRENELRAEQEKKAMMHKLADDFEAAVSGAVSSVAAAATELSQTAIDMTNLASKTNEQVVGVAAASNQTAGTVQTVAAAAEEMSSSVREISSQVSKSSINVREALEETKSANVISAQMLEAARAITSVTELIEGIAGQINLLALNATIESARAGDAGKGFAVVASEVKNLAGQTAKATEDIRLQLGGLGQMAENVAAALVKLGGSVEKVNETSRSIASAVEEQTAVTQEIATNMNTTASAVDQINGNISGIQKSTETTSAATQQILSSANMLSEQAEDLNLQVKTFLGSIRAA